MPTGLTSWKEIADYLGVNVRTTQKWERERGLPVRRLRGVKGRVSADPAELDEWKRRVLHRASWWSSLAFLRSYAIITTSVAVVLLVALLGTYLTFPRKGPPALFRIDFNTLTVTDSGGNELWRKVFEQPLQAEGYSKLSFAVRPRVWFGNLDGDSGVETLFIYDPADRSKIGKPLICFAENGQEKWRFVPGRTVRDQDSAYPPPYIVENFLVAPLGEDGAPRILITSHHITWHPNQFVMLDGNGKVLCEYWHSGQLSHIELGDLEGDGVPEVFLGGVNNGYKAAAIVVLDPKNVSGACTQLEGEGLQLQGFGPGTEKALVLFPRTCINRKFGTYNAVTKLVFQHGGVTVAVLENQYDKDCGVEYELDKNLQVTRVEFSDYLRSYHRRLEATGELDHSLTEAEIQSLRNVRVLRKSPPAS